MEFLEKFPPPCCLVLRNKGGIFSKQHQNPQNFRAFGADFDLIYNVIIHINDVFGLLRAAGEFFSVSDAFLSDFPLKNNDFQWILHQNSPKFSPGLRPGCCETRGGFSQRGEFSLELDLISLVLMSSGNKTNLTAHWRWLYRQRAYRSGILVRQSDTTTDRWVWPGDKDTMLGS